jgi:hypothetical protein
MKIENRIEMLSINSLLSAFHLGIRNVYKSSNYVKYVWVTPEADENCEICKSMDGVEVELKDVEGIINAHPNCGCFLIPKM